MSEIEQKRFDIVPLTQEWDHVDISSSIYDEISNLYSQKIGTRGWEWFQPDVGVNVWSYSLFNGEADYFVFHCVTGKKNKIIRLVMNYKSKNSDQNIQNYINEITAFLKKKNLMRNM